MTARVSQVGVLEKTDEAVRGLEAIAALFIQWALGWGTGAVRALVIMKGWEWFVSDTFDVTTLSFIQAWGIALLVSFLTISISRTASDGRRPLTIVRMNVFSSLMLSWIYFVSLLILSAFL